MACMKESLGGAQPRTLATLDIMKTEKPIEISVPTDPTFLLAKSDCRLRWGRFDQRSERLQTTKTTNNASPHTDATTNGSITTKLATRKMIASTTIPKDSLRGMVLMGPSLCENGLPNAFHASTPIGRVTM